MPTVDGVECVLKVEPHIACPRFVQHAQSPRVVIAPAAACSASVGTLLGALLQAVLFTETMQSIGDDHRQYFINSVQEAHRPVADGTPRG